MDYRELLKKYINYVGECEGTTFLSWNHPNGVLNDEEFVELEALEGEAYADMKRRAD